MNSITFTSVGNTVIKLTKVGKPIAINFSYNVNEVVSLSDGQTITFSWLDSTFSKNFQNRYQFITSGDGTLVVSGTINDLIDDYQYCCLFKDCTNIVDASQLILPNNTTDWCYACMFMGCVNLASAPTLPATTIAKWCYQGMFAGCTLLANAPNLPAETLTPKCYFHMFNSCESMENTPYLPASALTDWCYTGMFRNCQNLQTISCNFTTWEPLNATAGWNTNTSKAGSFKNQNLQDNYNIPEGWTFNDVIISAAPSSAIPSGDPTSGHSSSDFYNGHYTSDAGIVEAGLVPHYDPTGQGLPYYYTSSLTFFPHYDSASIAIETVGSPSNSISLQYKKNDGEWQNYTIGDIINLSSGEQVSFSGANNVINNNSINYYHFATTGLIDAAGSIQDIINKRFICPTNCFTNLFANCTGLVIPPQLPAVDINVNGYRGMFSGCTSLNNVPELPAWLIDSYCYADMFAGCTALYNVPQTLLPATRLLSGCYDGMFKGCTNLNTAPALQASGLVDGCYNNMFSGCSRLYIVSVGFTDWNNGNSTQNWLNDVATSGTIMKSTALSTVYGNNYIPEGWDIYNYDEVIEEPPVSGLTKEIANSLPLTIESFRDTTTVSLSAVGTPSAINLNYSKNGGAWTAYTIGDTIELSTNETVAFSGNNNYFSKNSSNYYNFNIQDGYVDVYGNAASIVNSSISAACYSNLFRNCSGLVNAQYLILPATTLTDSCYERMFFNCTRLQVGPDLPATKLAPYCYAYMFSFCSGLLSAPILPAKNLIDYCYTYMFSNCKSIRYVDVAFTDWHNGTYWTQGWLANASASGIFNKPYTLSTVIGTSNIPSGWTVTEYVPNITPPTSGNPLTFTAVTSTAAISFDLSGQTNRSVELGYKLNNDEWTGYRIGNVIELTSGDTVSFYGPNETINNYTSNFYHFNISGQVEASGNVQSLVDYSNEAEAYCFAYLFKNCSGLITAPELPATTINLGSYYGMFQNCKYLTSAPSCLPATTLADSCYESMFEGCFDLMTAPILPATTLAEGCYSYMFEECCNLRTAPALPATTLADSCYYAMFMYCTSLTSAPQLPATDLTYECYSYMFTMCSGIVNAPSTLPATTLTEDCYSNMFGYCTSLTASPQIKATTLAPNCCYCMFANCQNLSSISVDFTEWDDENDATFYWNYGVAASGTFYKPSTLSTVYSENGIPVNWTVVNK